MKLKNKKEDFLVCYLVARLLGNILTGKGINRAEEGIVRAGYGNRKGRKATTKNKWDF